jgi:hypothetical protein
MAPTGCGSAVALLDHELGRGAVEHDIHLRVRIARVGTIRRELDAHECGFDVFPVGREEVET